MRVAVIGAGIAGVATAYELAADGHAVTVFERRSGVAVEGSFAHAGLVCPEFNAAFGLFQGHGRTRSALDPRTWLSRMGSRRAAKLSGSEDPRRASYLRMARQGLQRLRQLPQACRFEFEQAEGCLLLLRDRREVEAIRPALSMLTDWGGRFALVDAARCREIEPGLGEDATVHAGVHWPDAISGNCRQFSAVLRGEAERLGAVFRFDANVTSTRPGAQPSIEVAASVPAASDTHIPKSTRETVAPSAQETFDAVVACNAGDAARLLRPLGLKLRLTLFGGCSVTAPLRHHDAFPDLGPRAAVLDLSSGVSIGRIGQRVRIAGPARPETIDDAALPSETDALYRSLDAWFPGVMQHAHAQRWQGMQARTADGLPLVGRTGIPGVWLNVGHGADGWAFACGGARVLANELAGRESAGEPSAFDPMRFG